MTTVALGYPIPLFVILESGANDKVIKANIVNPLTGIDIHTDIELLYMSGSEARYKSAEEIAMPDVQNLLIQYRIYEADGITLLQEDSETVELASSGGSGGGGFGGSSAESIIGIVEDSDLVGVVSDEEV
jgi:hypothetical protein